jgi:hypothetical protein
MFDTLGSAWFGNSDLHRRKAKKSDPVAAKLA